MEALRRIKLLILDVDGVLTDGAIVVDANGLETKNFDVQDGLGLVLLRQSGIKTAVISARKSGVVKHRAEDLGIDKTYVGVYPKISAYEELLREWNLADQDVCMIGDDVTDLVLLKKAGVGVAVANAVFEIKQHADYVTSRPGGRGAVREVVELILKAQGKWGPHLYEH